MFVEAVELWDQDQRPPETSERKGLEPNDLKYDPLGENRQFPGILRSALSRRRSIGTPISMPPFSGVPYVPNSGDGPKGSPKIRPKVRPNFTISHEFKSPHVRTICPPCFVKIWPRRLSKREGKLGKKLGEGGLRRKLYAQGGWMSGSWHSSLPLGGARRLDSGTTQWQRREHERRNIEKTNY